MYSVQTMPVVSQKMVLRPGERRGYWKRIRTNQAFRQTRVYGEVNHVGTRILLDSGAEMSILDLNFARKIGVSIDYSKQVPYVGVGGTQLHTVGEAKIKITLAKEYVYYFGVTIAPLPNSSQRLILGNDFMVPAGVRLDLANGAACLPNEVKLKFEDRRQLFGDHMRMIGLTDGVQIPPYGVADIKVFNNQRQTLWTTRGRNWIPRVIHKANGRPGVIEINNISDTPV